MGLAVTIVVVMKALVCLSLLVSGVSFAAELKDVKSVYLYPMAGGLDQHLANRLTKDHIFRIVADPKLADAILTDQLGRQFEYRLDHIKRDPLPATPPAPPAAPAAGQAASQPAAQPVPVPPAAGANSAEAEPHSSSFSRGKGTLFLVDAKSRQVVWSDYHPPRNSSSKELDKTAKGVATRLTKSLAPPAPERK